MPQFARILPVVIPAAVLVWVAASGCSLIPRTAPVSRELATARRLSNEGLTAADQQDLGRAESLFERAVRACPTDVDARRHFAEVLWKRGERVAAVGQIAEALEIAPHDEELCVVGGRMYLELGLLDDADCSTRPPRPTGRPIDPRVPWPRLRCSRRPTVPVKRPATCWPSKDSPRRPSAALPMPWRAIVWR